MASANGMRIRQHGGGTPVLNDWGVNSEYGTLRDVLLGPVDNLTLRETSAVSRASIRTGQSLDRDVAKRQYAEVISAYEDAGVTVHAMEPDETLTMHMYARDSSFMTPYGAVITQLAHWWRRGENFRVLEFYMNAGIPIYDIVTAGTFEGGDFNVIEPGCLLLGCGGERTQIEAAEQVKGWFEAEDWEVRLALFDPFYVHIDLMVCMLAEKIAAVCLDCTEPGIVQWLKDKNIEIIPVSFQDTMTLGCNVVSMGDHRILSTAASKDLNDKLRANGFTVYDPEVDMLTRCGGGVHCMAMPLRRDPV